MCMQRERERERGREREGDANLQGVSNFSEFLTSRLNIGLRENDMYRERESGGRGETHKHAER